MRNRKAWIVLSLVTISVLLFLQQGIQKEISAGGILKVHFLDVGQADSILVQTPGDKNILIDGGNASDGDTVINYLRQQGVKSLAAIIATHPHEDHIGGLAAVINAFSVAAVYMPDVVHTTRTFETFVRAVNASGAKRIRAKAGVKLDVGSGVTAALVAPNGSYYDDLNNYSAVLRIVYGKTAFLLAGDAEDVSEAEMVRSGQTLRADVLKVGHHGSSSSCTANFLKVVAPKYAVISVGAGNSYGHPSAQTLSALASRGIKIYRTDLQGTIVATSDGNTVKFNKKASPVKPHAPPAVTKAVGIGGGGNGNAIVYLTKSGTKYHRDGCRYLAKSKIPIKLSEAKKKGYKPCKVCKPPQ